MTNSICGNLNTLFRSGMSCLKRTGTAAASVSIQAINTVRDASLRINNTGQAYLRSGFNRAIRYLVDDLGFDPVDAIVTVMAVGSLAILNSFRMISSKENDRIDFDSTVILTVFTAYHIVDHVDRENRREHFWQILNNR